MKLEENKTKLIQILVNGAFILGSNFNPIYKNIFAFNNYNEKQKFYVSEFSLKY
jgi:hypothetical protein